MQGTTTLSTVLTLHRSEGIKKKSTEALMKLKKLQAETRSWML